MWSWQSYGPEDTLTMGRLLGKHLRSRDFVSLNGNLGTGKTLLIKGIVSSRGIDPKIVTSPSFNLVHQYQNTLVFFHFDVYRLNSPDELEDIGYEEYFYGSGICLVEWGNLIEAHLPADHLAVQIQQTSEMERKFMVHAVGRRSQELMQDWRDEWNDCIRC